jgi:hypothetical protein
MAQNPFPALEGSERCNGQIVNLTAGSSQECILINQSGGKETR